MRVIKTSAPGSIMLFGEHAVVRGGLGIATSLAGRVYVTLTPRTDRQVSIHSDRFVSLTCSLDNLVDDDIHAYTLGVLRHFQTQLLHGFDIHIHSDLSPTHGFGSSAALVVALIAALNIAVGSKPVSPEFCAAPIRARQRRAPTPPMHRELSLPIAPTCRDLFAASRVSDEHKLAIAALARTIIIDVQGCGSGCDAYASALGGTVAIRKHGSHLALHTPSPGAARHPLPQAGEACRSHAHLTGEGNLDAQRVPTPPQLTAIYTGYKTKTAVVLAQVAADEAKAPAHYAGLFNQINDQSEEARTYLQAKDWPALGRIMCEQFNLQQALGVADATSVSIKDTLDAMHVKTGQPWGAKISGSGLGDCLIALGDIPANLFPNTDLPATEQFVLALGTEGVRIDEANDPASHTSLATEHKCSHCRGAPCGCPSPSETSTHLLLSTVETTALKGESTS